MTFQIRKPDTTELPRILELATAMQLDTREMRQEEFIAAFDGQEICGFGRLRDHGSCVELCTLGVCESHRGKGLGLQLSRALVASTSRQIFLVTVIPAFFQKVGFRRSSTWPESLNSKLNFCSSSLPVSQRYEVMESPTP
jgi:N-acetylglutamate synthase-like GNAT family acetyltransferase